MYFVFIYYSILLGTRGSVRAGMRNLGCKITKKILNVQIIPAKY